MSWRIGADIGGTFTDVALAAIITDDETTIEREQIGAELSDPHRPLEHSLQYLPACGEFSGWYVPVFCG